VGNDPASEIYVRSKAKKAQELGLRGSERFCALRRLARFLRLLQRLGGFRFIEILVYTVLRNDNVADLVIRCRIKHCVQLSLVSCRCVRKDWSSDPNTRGNHFWFLKAIYSWAI